MKKKKISRDPDFKEIPKEAWDALILLSQRFQKDELPWWYQQTRKSFLCRICGGFFKKKETSLVEHGWFHLKESNLVIFL